MPPELGVQAEDLGVAARSLERRRRRLQCNRRSLESLPEPQNVTGGACNPSGGLTTESFRRTVGAAGAKEEGANQ